jgi:hypothetical protein
MTRNEFMGTFYGPGNRGNRERTLADAGIVSFAGIPAKRLGWAGLAIATSWTCGSSVFIEALAAAL